MARKAGQSVLMDVDNDEVGVPVNPTVTPDDVVKKTTPRRKSSGQKQSKSHKRGTKADDENTKKVSKKQHKTAETETNDRVTALPVTKKRRKNSIDIDMEEAASSRNVSMQATGDEPTKEPAQSTLNPPVEKLHLHVHRMRHLNFQPKAILCMAATPSLTQAFDYVAVSREDGSVEIKSPDEKWRTLARIAGRTDQTVDCMVWLYNDNDTDTATAQLSFTSDFHKSHTQHHAKRSLVGASKNGTLFVVNFSSSQPEAITPSGGGGIFCIASLGTFVAVGCEDGSVRTYNHAKTDGGKHTLTLVSTLPAAGSSILSLAWAASIKGGEGLDESVIFAGVADGTIRRYECKSSSTSARITWSSKIRMTVESLGRTTPTRVWALKVLSDGTLVSGDSLGHVQFWDGKTGTLLQSFEQNENKADTLAIVVTPDEDRVFASGIDSRVICIERPKQHSIQQEPPRWILTHAQRPHTHDVKALVICRMHDASGGLVPTAEPHVMLCSGGVDTKICTFRVQDFRSNRPRTWFPWPSPASPISIARAARILLFRREGSMELHKLGSTSGAPSLPVILEDRKTCLGSIDIKSSHNLMCSDISQDGKYVIASTGTTLLMFEIGYTESEDGTLGFTPKQLSLSNKLKAPCVVAKFAASDTVVCVGMDGCVRIVKINRAADEDTPTVIEIDAVTVETTGVNTSFPVHTVAVSQDGKFFATIRSGIGSGVLTIFALQNDKIHQLWSLSALEAPIANAAFLSGSRPQLAVACSNFAMYVFNVHERRLSEWSEKNGFPVSPKLPYELTKHLDFPTCVLTNEKHPEKFIVGAFGSFCVTNMVQGMPKRCKTVPIAHVRGRKRKKYVEETKVDPNHGNCTLCMRYNSIIHTDFVSDKEMVVVEQPWLNVVAGFPPALERKVYGT